MRSAESIVRIRDRDGIRILSLSNPSANALNAEMVETLLAHVAESERDDRVGGLLFESLVPGFFSAGFDVREVFAYERDAMSAFFKRFVKLYEALLRLPKPVGGALSGHTVAGGAFLALCFDLRVMAEGDYAFAVNEVKFGAIVPSAVTKLLIDAVGSRIATQMILSGDAVAPRRALEIGLVDAVVPLAEVTPVALELVTKFASQPRGAFGLAKRKLHEDLGHLSASAQPAAIEEFLDKWFSPECAQLRRTLAERILN